MIKSTTKPATKPATANLDELLPTPPSEHTVETGSIRKRSSFGRTLYYIDSTRERAVKGPGQLLGIVKFMLDNGITSPDTAMQGSAIGRAAVESGHVATNKLTGEVIFAYYARWLEREYGMEHSATIHAATNKQMA